MGESHTLRTSRCHNVLKLMQKMYSDYNIKISFGATGLTDSYKATKLFLILELDCQDKIRCLAALGFVVYAQRRGPVRDGLVAFVC